MLGYFDFVDGPLPRASPPTTPGCCRCSARSSRSCSRPARIRAVFATETLALGINMPARTVVLEKLVKFNGEAHVDITPAEYTQLTGRAGRRGIDVEGHAVVQWARGIDPLAVGGLASTAHLPAALELPAHLQHGRQPRRPGRARGGPRDPRDLVRPVPGRPRRRRHRDRRCAATRRAWRATPRRCTATSATSASTPRCAAPSPTRRRRASRPAPRRGVPRRPCRSRRCGSATSSASRPGGEPGGQWSCSRPRRARAPRPGRRSSPRTSSSAGSPWSTCPSRSSRWHARQGAAELQPQVAEVAARPGDLAADRRAPRVRGLAAAPGRAGHGRESPSARALRHERSRTRATSAPTARTHARWAERWWRLQARDGRPAAQGRGPHQHRGPHLRPDLRRPRRAGLPRRRRHGGHRARGAAAAALHREGPARGRVPASHDVWKRLDAAGLAAVVSTLVHEPRRDETEVAPGCRTTTSPRRWTRMSELWSQIEDLETEHDLPSTAVPGRRDGLDGAPLGVRASGSTRCCATADGRR